MRIAALIAALGVATLAMASVQPNATALAAHPDQNTLTVNSTEDTDDILWGDGQCGDELGRCTLRGAIQEANATEGEQRIRFRIASGIQVLRPDEALPVIFESVTIDGTTQPGYAGSPLIHLDGSGAGNNADGVVIASEDSTVRGLAITGFEGTGVVVTESDASRVESCFIGLAPDGSTAGNGLHGVHVQRARDTVIGGTELALRNVIAGNGGNGIYISEFTARGNRVVGNFIGTDVSGEVAVPNRVDGVSLDNAPGNFVGGGEAGEVNLIAGNGDDGVEIVGPGAVSNTVQSNFIGTSRTGDAPLGNGDAGVLLEASTDNDVVGNVVATNRGHGVELSDGARRNAVRSNIIGGTGVTQTLGNGGAGVALLDSVDNMVGGTTGAAGNQIAANLGAGVLVAGSGARDNRIAFNRIGLLGEALLANGGSGVMLREGAARTEVFGNVLREGMRVYGPGTHGNELRGNDVRPLRAQGAPALPAIEVGYGARDTSLTGNDIRASAGHGIVVAGRDTVGTLVSGNVISRSRKSGIVVEADAPPTTVGVGGAAYNIVLGSVESGVVLKGEGHTLVRAAVGIHPHTGEALANGQAFARQPGILVHGRGHVISGTLVAANSGDGVQLAPDASEVQVLGNTIGTEVIAGGAPPNGLSGVRVAGDGHAIEDNVITGHPGAGVAVVAGRGHDIVANRLAGNGLGIDLGDDGVTANDPGDDDDGPNRLLNFPVLERVETSGRDPHMVAVGVMAYEGGPSLELSFDLYGVSACHASGHGEGDTSFGSLPFTTRPSGEARGQFSVQPLPPGIGGLAATARDEAGNTSEFGPCVPIMRSHIYVPATARP